jgi:hypothetical protein
MKSASTRRRQRESRFGLAIVTLIITLLVVFELWANHAMYQAHICREVPNHYSCEQ